MAAPKLLKASEVCDLVQVQPYVLRSWEKEFPGIGVQKQPDGPRLYRQSDVDHVLRIKQLVFSEGLTLAGARRRLDEQPNATVPASLGTGESTDDVEVSPLLEDVLGHETRVRIQRVRMGLKSILEMLSRTPHVAPETFDLRPPEMNEPPAHVRTVTSRASAREAPAKNGKRKRASA